MPPGGGAQNYACEDERMWECLLVSYGREIGERIGSSENTVFWLTDEEEHEAEENFWSENQNTQEQNLAKSCCQATDLHFTFNFTSVEPSSFIHAFLKHPVQVSKDSTVTPRKVHPGV